MPLTVLVADDDVGIRTAISDFLEASGYSVIAAENGQMALELVGELQPHLIVTDIAMPQMDGYELVRRIRQHPASRLTPVIFLTARNETADRVRGYQSGCDVYLAKPFELEELGAVVRNLLERLQMLESEWRSQRGGPSDLTGETLTAAEAADASLTLSALELTPRERDVLSVLSDGLSNAQIGEKLHLSPRTVEKYVSSLLRKTDTANRAELVRFAMDHHLLESSTRSP